MKNITRALVLPLLSAGVIGGAALGLAGPAAAATTTTHTNGSHSIVTTPDTRATDKAHGGQQQAGDVTGAGGARRYPLRRSDHRALVADFDLV